MTRPERAANNAADKAEGGVMRIKLESHDKKVARLGTWRNWFAWRPVQVGGALVWLEAIQRRYEYVEAFNAWDAQYRLAESGPDLVSAR
jgi:hypothetical protein